MTKSVLAFILLLSFSVAGWCDVKMSCDCACTEVPQAVEPEPVLNDMGPLAPLPAQEQDPGVTAEPPVPEVPVEAQ